MKLLLCLALAFPLVVRAETSAFTQVAPQKTSELSGKMLPNKEFRGFGGKSTTFADKNFPLPAATDWKDKNAPGFSKSISSPEVTFNKEFATKIFRLDQRVTLRTGDVPFTTSQRAEFDTRQANAAWEKKFPVRDYNGKETAIIQREMEMVRTGLSKIKDIPDHELSISEVKALLNRDSRPDRPVSPEHRTR